MSVTVPPAGTVPTPPWAIPPTTITDPATFRSHFPAFADTARYPDATVQFFLDLGTAMCNPDRWLNFQQYGAELVCAHFLAMQQLAMQGGATTGVPGLATGPRSSKSVSKVSVGYDVGITAIEGAGPFNYTMYGQEYWRMVLLVGTGGYETLALSTPGMAGFVNTWAKGVLIGWLPW